MAPPFVALYRRDLRLALRRRVDAGLPLAFMAVAVAIFPLGVGPEPQMLRQIAPGVVWVCALLATMLSVNTLWSGDFADGSMEQMLLCGTSVTALAAAKAAAHWTITGLPLVVAALLFGVLFDLPVDTSLALVNSLLLGTPVLSLLGSLGAALTVGLRSAGLLVIVLVLPLSIPALVFGAGAVSAVESGQTPAGHYSILGALLIFTALTAPLATAAALRIAVD